MATAFEYKVTNFSYCAFAAIFFSYKMSNISNFFNGIFGRAGKPHFFEYWDIRLIITDIGGVFRFDSGIFQYFFERFCF